jgi:hypothetical protein
VTPANLRKTAENIIQLYQAWEKPEQAAQWQAELDQLKPTEQSKD